MMICKAALDRWDPHLAPGLYTVTSIQTPIQNIKPRSHTLHAPSAISDQRRSRLTCLGRMAALLGLEPSTLTRPDALSTLAPLDNLNP